MSKPGMTDVRADFEQWWLIEYGFMPWKGDSKVEEMYGCWKAAMSQRERTCEAVCRICNGNDGDMPCAYTTEKPDGCLRAARLAPPSPPSSRELLGKAVGVLREAEKFVSPIGTRLRIQQVLIDYDTQEVRALIPQELASSEARIEPSKEEGNG
jgi:hypothetical protein